MATSGSKSVAVTAHDTLKFNWSLSSQSVANNTSTISWNMQLISDAYGRISSTASKDYKVVVNGTTYSGTNTVGIAASTTKTLKSGTTTIAHNSDGTKTFSFSFSQEFAITFSGASIGTKSGSGSGTLTTIPRKSTLSVGNGILGKSQTLTVTRQSTSFTHTIVATCGSASTTICTKSTSTSISFTPPESWASQNTSGTSVSVKYTITTYNGSTSLGSNSYTKSCTIPSDEVPTVSLTVEDANGYEETYGAYIQGISKFKVTLTAAGSSGSTIKSYKTTANGSTYTASSFTTGVLKSSGTLTVNATVTDSRSRTASASQSLTVLPYAAPKISSISLKRCNSSGVSDSGGAYLCLTFSSVVSSLNNQNTVSYVLQYKKTTASSYTTVTLTNFTNQYSVTNGTYIFAADVSSSYDIILTVTDKFKTVDSNGTGSSTSKLFSFLKKGLGFAFGKVAELENVLDIEFQTRFNGGILQPKLKAGTDFNSLIIPNTYTLLNATSAGYVNNPLLSGTGTLTVEECGDEGQIHQIIKVCSKTNPLIYERFYYQSSWGEWINVSSFGNRLLWSGGSWMNASQTAQLSEAISKQKNGIVLVFSRYSDSTVRNYNFNTYYISKYEVAAHDGVGHTFIIASDSALSYVSSKYLYIYDTKITGHDNNVNTGTSASNIIYTNNQFVLRYVVGV